MHLMMTVPKRRKYKAPDTVPYLLLRRGLCVLFYGVLCGVTAFLARREPHWAPELLGGLGVFGVLLLYHLLQGMGEVFLLRRLAFLRQRARHKPTRPVEWTPPQRSRFSIGQRITGATAAVATGRTQHGVMFLVYGLSATVCTVASCPKPAPVTSWGCVTALALLFAGTGCGVMALWHLARFFSPVPHTHGSE